MYDSPRSSAPTPLARVGGSERRANFVAHVGVVVGDEGKAVLAEEGVDAHRVSSELQGVARDNTPTDAKRTTRTRRRRRVVAAVLGFLFVAGLVWVADNVAGYVSRPRGATAVRVDDGTLTSTVVLADGRRVTADCFDAGAGVTVWKAPAPAGWIVGYRCGNEPLAAEFPGRISVAAAALALLGLGLLVGLRARWRRTAAWY